MKSLHKLITILLLSCSLGTFAYEQEHPTGVLMAKSTNPGQQRYKYNGKEFEPLHGLNWNDYGARWYDPATNLFTTIDPLCEKYYHIYPYAYCAGNPVNRVDPDGEDWYQNKETKYYTWYAGNNEREGFTYIGTQGSVLGEFENVIDNVLSGENGIGLESIYTEGFTFDIAPNDKGALIASKERGWDFFSEFINGTGPEFTVLLGEHPYTINMKNDASVIEAQNKLRNGPTDIEGQITNFGRKFKAKDILTTGSFAKQFIGSYRYDGYTSEDGYFINNVITDSKSRTSLFYHGGLYNPRRKESTLLSNTYQFYIWKSKK